MPERDQVFLSYSHNDHEAALNLRNQLEKAGIGVFRDEEGIRAGDLWLDRLQMAVDGCAGFVVLVGREGVARWVGAETQAALNRYFGPRDDKDRLPIFPLLLDNVTPESLPAFLRLFQATSWNGVDPLSATFVEQIQARRLTSSDRIAFEGCPFVGLASYRIDQAQLFFGRQKETLDALACFDTRPGHAAVRWLEINGNSGSGKSSLMNAGLLPLVEQGWLWARTGIAHWRRIGPMMPGANPVAMLAEQLARTFSGEMAEVRRLLDADERGLADWLRGRKQDDTAFLLAIDQFEELFTFADPEERGRFDRLLATALDDADCPLFVISTVRADFLDRIDELPRLVAVRNRIARPWTLPPIGAEGLREIISGPARLAGLDVSEVQEAMVVEAQDEPGGLPLVENGLQWLWEHREPSGKRLSGKLLTQAGGLAGVLSVEADALLASLGPRREGALDLLFRLVNVDPESKRHTRRRIPYPEAVAVAGGRENGRMLIGRLAGERQVDGGQAHGPLRLITVTNEADGAAGPGTDGRQVNLIHETLIRTKAPDADGKRQPFWPTLWTFIEQHKDRAVRRERLRLLAREWQDCRGWARFSGLAGWRDVFGFRGLAVPGSIEQRYLRWSSVITAAQACIFVAVLVPVGENLIWAWSHDLPLATAIDRWAYLLGKEPPFPEWVRIPTGSFAMGNDYFAIGNEDYGVEQPRHEVTIVTPFDMSSSEVTFDQWDACVADGGCRSYRPSDQGWGRGNQPVINVSWNDAHAYTEWLTLRSGRHCRLPSEAEWEYACRAGNQTQNALPQDKGGDEIVGQDLANCIGCGSKWDDKRAAPVAQFPANSRGLYDMLGNVLEWVEDCWHESYKNAPSDGHAWLAENWGKCNSRALRGGSWVYHADGSRCAARFRFSPDLRNYFTGFRVVCTSPSSSTDP